MIKSKAYKIVDEHFDNWNTEVLGDKWVYDDFVRSPKYKEGWISLTSLVNDEANDQVYIGIGTFSANLLYSFDRTKKTFKDHRYKSIADPFDAKFHCSLEMDENGDLYAGVAQFHDVDKQFEAKGGRLIKYETQKQKFKVLDIPVKGSYIQSIALDRQRDIIYGYTLSPEYLFKHELSTGKSEVILNVGNSYELCQTHNPVIDDEGKLWGTYGITRAFTYDPGEDSIRIFSYDPDTGKVQFFDHGLPRIGEGDKGKVDRAINGGDGFLYFGGISGSFSRLNPKTGEVTLIGKPCPNRRLAGLCKGPDGNIYGVGGDNYYATVFRYDPKKEKLEVLGRIFDETIQEAPVRIHTITMTDDGILYCGENDNNYRSSYLWECDIS